MSGPCCLAAASPRDGLAMGIILQLQWLLFFHQRSRRQASALSIDLAENSRLMVIFQGWYCVS